MKWRKATYKFLFWVSVSERVWMSDERGKERDSEKEFERENVFSGCIFISTLLFYFNSIPYNS